MNKNVKKSARNHYDELSTEIMDEFGVKMLLKGSYGYGIPSDESDYDIQVDAGSYDVFEKIVKRYKAKTSSIMFRDSTGDKYRSTIASFKRNGKEINLVFDEHPKVWKLVQEVTGKIKALKEKEKYAIRLVSEGLKYDRLDSVDIFLRLYKNYKDRFDPRLIRDVEEGKILNSKVAQQFRTIFQLLYHLEVGSNYSLKELSKLKL